jgi:hypothetical protein
MDEKRMECWGEGIRKELSESIVQFNCTHDLNIQAFTNSII